MDTVDKMPGQQSRVVIVSYGVSDLETALQEGEFIYSRNRLNVSIIRARAQCLCSKGEIWDLIRRGGSRQEGRFRFPN